MTLTIGKPSLNQHSCIPVVRTGRETRGIEHRSRMRRVSLQPFSIGVVTKPRVTMKEKLNSGMMEVTPVDKVSRERRHCESSSVEMRSEVQSCV